MKGHVALFHSWLRDIMSKSVDKSESGLFDSDCRHFFRRNVTLFLFLMKRFHFVQVSHRHLGHLFEDKGVVDRLHVSNN